MSEIAYIGGDSRQGRVGGPRDCYPYETAVTTPGTAVGADTAFAAAPTHVAVIADKDVWIGKSQAELGQAGDGSYDGRVFLAANERRVLPWGTRAFWLVNVQSGESPKVRAEGWL